MRQVLLVDDEYLVRERLKRAVDWEEYGFRVAGEAENGEDGLALLEELDIALAIVDINMPLVDGLEFARIAGERHPGLRMVILTGYGTFEYAQAAIRAGACDYLLKPINRDEFKGLLARIGSELREEEEAEAQRREALQESGIIVRDRWVLGWLEGTVPWTAESFGRFCPELTVTRRYVVLAAAADQAEEEGGSKEDGFAAGPSPERERLQSRDRAGEREAVGFLTEACAAAGLRFEAVEDAEDRRLFVIGLDAEGTGEGAVTAAGEEAVKEAVLRADTEEFEEALSRLCESALSSAREAGLASIAVGMSKPFEDWAEAAGATRQAAYALAYRTLRGGGRLLRHVDRGELPPGAKWLAVRDRVLILLRLGNAQAMADAVDEWLTEFESPDASLEQLCLLLGEIAAAFRLYATEFRREADGIVPADMQPFALAWRLGSLDRIRGWLLARSALLLERTAEEARRPTSLLAEKAKEYIDREFADPELDLNAIAGAIAVNSSYLSRTFKQETGWSVIEYVTLRRMTRAKELLDRGVRNLAYVSESVGYSDALYFSKCFKKQYGVPPSRFTEMPK